MSTRCTVHFHDGNGDNGYLRAIVYRHSDGYPESDVGMLADLERFFSDVQKQTRDTRFNDAAYLAAKFVVWQANQYAKKYDYDTQEYKPAPMLDFLSVGVMLDDPGDIEYRYHVWCDTDDKPEVTWEKV